MTKTTICGWYGISRQAHAQMLKRRQRVTQQEQKALAAVAVIRRQHPLMGARKLLYKLANQDIQIGRDRFFALLRRMGLLVRRRRKGRRTTFPGGYRSENLLKNAKINQPDQAYVADITYLETEQGFLYLALVTDLYSRKILGWDLSDSLALAGASRAMQKAISQADKPLSGLIHHSDHGVQYTSRSYLELLARHGIRSSMGQVGNAYDNAVAERVNGILKLEYLLDQRFVDADAARRAVAEAIRLYNTDRPHLSLDYQTPEQVYRQSSSAVGDQAAIAERPAEAPCSSRVGETDLLQPWTKPSFRRQSAEAAWLTPSFSLDNVHFKT